MESPPLTKNATFATLLDWKIKFHLYQPNIPVLILTLLDEFPIDFHSFVSMHAVIRNILMFDKSNPLVN